MSHTAELGHMFLRNDEQSNIYCPDAVVKTQMCINVSLVPNKYTITVWIITKNYSVQLFEEII